VKQPGKYLEESIPLGKPVYNARLVILNRHFRPVPVGIPGELFIGGDGVGVGYFNDPTLTSEKFVIISFEQETDTGLLFYRTGDLVKWLPEGVIEFLGRIDHQVKIRGFRIELGEIESRLLTHEKIKDAVVIARESTDDKYICAYIVSEREFTSFELKEYLSAELPDYMIPSYFVQLDKIPLTPNGKVDREALLSLGTPLGTGVEYVPPGSEIDKKIAGIWKEILKQEKISIHDNFFEIGGDSLLIIRLNSSLKKAFNKDISVASMFRYPTVRTMGEYLAGNETVENAEGPLLLQDRLKETGDGKERLKQRIMRRRGGF
jgi:acyl carrier protein